MLFKNIFHCCLSKRQQSIHLVFKMTSCKWWPLFTIHCCRRSLKISITCKVRALRSVPDDYFKGWTCGLKFSIHCSIDFLFGTKSFRCKMKWLRKTQYYNYRLTSLKKTFQNQTHGVSIGQAIMVGDCIFKKR